MGLQAGILEVWVQVFGVIGCFEVEDTKSSGGFHAGCHSSQLRVKLQPPLGFRQHAVELRVLESRVWVRELSDRLCGDERSPSEVLFA